MTNVELVTAADVAAHAGSGAAGRRHPRWSLAKQRATFGEAGLTLWARDTRPTAQPGRAGCGSPVGSCGWGCAISLPHHVRRSDGVVVKHVTGANVVVPGSIPTSGAGRRGDRLGTTVRRRASSARCRRAPPTSSPSSAGRRTATSPDRAALGDDGSWHPCSTTGSHRCGRAVLPAGFRVRTADEAGPRPRPVPSGRLGSLDVFGRGLRRCPADGGVSRRLHILVEAAGRTSASSTIMWLDERTDRLSSSRSGTHPDYGGWGWTGQCCCTGCSWPPGRPAPPI